MVFRNPFLLLFVCVCVRAIFQKRLNQYLQEIFTQNVYGATDVSFGGFDPLAIATF